MSIKVCIITGEESGDMIAGDMLSSLRVCASEDIEAFGVGGNHLKQYGFESFTRMEIFSIMGIVNVLKEIKTFRREIKQLAEKISTRAPDIVVTVDSPGLSYYLVKELRGRGVVCPIVHYVVPSIWAWRYERIYKFKRYFDHLFALFSFEVPFVEEAGMPCTYVGHPLFGRDWSGYKRETFRKRHYIEDSHKLVAVFPGSRMSEIDRLLPVFYDSLCRMKEREPSVMAIIPTLSHTHKKIKSYFERRGDISFMCVDREEKYNAVKACDVALAASGTVSLEIGLLGIPMVIAYKVSWLNKILASLLVQIKWVCLINILAGEEVVPERLQEMAKPEILAQDCLGLMGQDGAAQRQRLQSVLSPLCDGDAPSVAAAQKVMSLVSASCL